MKFVFVLLCPTFFKNLNIALSRHDLQMFVYVVTHTNIFSSSIAFYTREVCKLWKWWMGKNKITKINMYEINLFFPCISPFLFVLPT
jgi:hypothetical protein